MLRLRCTPDDLLRVTIARHPAPLAELTMAVQMLQRRDPDPLFAPWRARVARTLPRRAGPLFTLISPLGAGPYFLDPPSPTADEGMAGVLETGVDEVRSELRRMCAIDRPLTPWVRRLGERDREAWDDLEAALWTGYHAILAADWPRIRAGFHAETAFRSRMLARHGLHATLASLGPALRWHGTTLEADFPRDVDLDLGGRGLVLRPSLLWRGHPLAAHEPSGATVLIYPALTPLPLLQATDPATDSLGALLGITRANALRLLDRELTTTDLARDLSVTVAAASMQAKTLREAGLITSRREGKAVWHQRTPLGFDLLAGGS
ncbi:ArsR family transcriptional regulator [Actinokineospora enzanensis]|uniref:ArsR family transcriptional regulator n=1 Tax=Actinokineospora enzanensis TaxID=155975 RepID=UPI00037C437B|nr:ArsR family transcriptional regulator [Actinokineospora enzanensis]